MNLFRRLFSQPENNQAEQQPPPTPMPAVKADEKIEVATAPSFPPASAQTAELRINIADGVTRPLPPEPVMLYTGNEHLVFGQASDVGMVRNNNQDAALSFFSTARSVEDRPDFGLFIVADGMGGHHDGEKASAITTRTMAVQVTNTILMPLMSGKNDGSSAPISETLANAVQKANSEVINNVPDGGTTLTAVVIIGDLAYIAHVGDSRVYLMTSDGPEQLTRDHSLVQRLIELDHLLPEEAADHPQKNVLYRALGQNEALEVDTLTRRLPPNSHLLLCSDGLWNQVEDREIFEIVKRYSNPQEACEKLVALANARGGLDNVTIILLQMPG